jgi:hypothetical protein
VIHQMNRVWRHGNELESVSNRQQQWYWLKCAVSSEKMENFRLPQEHIIRATCLRWVGRAWWSSSAVLTMTMVLIKFEKDQKIRSDLQPLIFFLIFST